MSEVEILSESPPPPIQTKGLHEKQILECELMEICSALGEWSGDPWMEGSKFTPGRFAQSALRDLGSILRRDDPELRDVFELLCGWETMENILLPLAIEKNKDPKIPFSVAKIVVQMTMPTPKDSGKLRKHNSLMLKLKEGFLRDDCITVFSHLLVEPLSKSYLERTDRDRATIELLLCLFRNLLQISDVAMEFDSESRARILRNKMLAVFEMEHVLEFLLAFTQEINDVDSSLNSLLILEVWMLVFRDFEPCYAAGLPPDAPCLADRRTKGDNLRTKAEILRDMDLPSTLVDLSIQNLPPAMSRTGIKNKENSTDLLSFLTAEEAAKKKELECRFRHSRHPRFGGAFQVHHRNGAKLVVLDDPQKRNELPADLRPKGKRGRKFKDLGDEEELAAKIRPNMEGSPNLMASLRDVANHLLSIGFNEIMEDVRDKLVQDSYDIIPTDKLSFLKFASTILEYHLERHDRWFPQEKLDHASVRSLMWENTISFLFRQIEQAADSKWKSWSYTLQVCRLLRLIFRLVAGLMKNEGTKHLALEMEEFVFEHKERIDLLVKLVESVDAHQMNSFKKKRAPFEMVVEATSILHYAVQFLEGFQELSGSQLMVMYQKHARKKADQLPLEEEPEPALPETNLPEDSTALPDVEGMPVLPQEDVGPPAAMDTMDAEGIAVVEGMPVLPPEVQIEPSVAADGASVPALEGADDEAATVAIGVPRLPDDDFVMGDELERQRESHADPSGSGNSRSATVHAGHVSAEDDAENNTSSNRDEGLATDMAVDGNADEVEVAPSRNAEGSVPEGLEEPSLKSSDIPAHLAMEEAEETEPAERPVEDVGAGDALPTVNDTVNESAPDRREDEGQEDPRDELEAHNAVPAEEEEVLTEGEGGGPVNAFRMFDFDVFFHRIARSHKVFKQYSILLSKYKALPVAETLRVLDYFKRIYRFKDGYYRPKLYQLSLLMTLHSIMNDQSLRSHPQLAALRNFAKKVTASFFSVGALHKGAFVDALFKKRTKDFEFYFELLHPDIAAGRASKKRRRAGEEEDDDDVDGLAGKTKPTLPLPTKHKRKWTPEEDEALFNLYHRYEIERREGKAQLCTLLSSYFDNCSGQEVEKRLRQLELLFSVREPKAIQNADDDGTVAAEDLERVRRNLQCFVRAHTVHVDLGAVSWVRDKLLDAMVFVSSVEEDGNVDGYSILPLCDSDFEYFSQDSKIFAVMASLGFLAPAFEHAFWRIPHTYSRDTLRSLCELLETEVLSVDLGSLPEPPVLRLRREDAALGEGHAMDGLTVGPADEDDDGSVGDDGDMTAVHGWQEEVDQAAAEAAEAKASRKKVKASKGATKAKKSRQRKRDRSDGGDNEGDHGEDYAPEGGPDVSPPAWEGGEGQSWEVGEEENVRQSREERGREMDEGGLTEFMAEPSIEVPEPTEPTLAVDERLSRGKRGRRWWQATASRVSDNDGDDGLGSDLEDIADSRPVEESETMGEFAPASEELGIESESVTMNPASQRKRRRLAKRAVTSDSEDALSDGLSERRGPGMDDVSMELGVSDTATMGVEASSAGGGARRTVAASIELGIDAES